MHTMPREGALIGLLEARFGLRWHPAYVQTC